MTAPLMAAVSMAVDARFVADVVADQHLAHPVHHTTECIVVGEEAVDDGIVQDGAHGAAVGNREFHDPVHQRVSGPCRRTFCLRRPHHRLQLGQLVLGGGENDLVLGVELVVDGRLGHADGIGDHLQRGPSDPVTGEQVEGCVDDPGLRSSRPGLPDVIRNVDPNVTHCRAD